MSAKLPIDIVTDSYPVRFQWQRKVTTPNGLSTVDCNGSMPVSVEAAVQALIVIAKQQAKYIEELQHDNLLLSKKLEASNMQQVQLTKKGKG